MARQKLCENPSWTRGGDESSTKSSEFFSESAEKTVKSSALDPKMPFELYNS